MFNELQECSQFVLISELFKVYIIKVMSAGIFLNYTEF